MDPETAPDVQKRLEALEKRVAFLEKQLAERFSFWKSYPAIPSPKPSISPQEIVQEAAPPAPPEVTAEDAEVRIGKYWLNRIGIGALVLGIAFFISYTFRYFGPIAKLGIGCLVSVVIAGVGVFHEKKEGYHWYGSSLVGGGWALFYFTTYAAHHLEVVRVIQSQLLDLFLLCAVSVGAVLYALKRYKSQVMTGSYFLLAFITSAISHEAAFALTSCLITSVALAYLIRYFQWHRLALFASAATYLVHLSWMRPQLALEPYHGILWDASRFWLSMGFLSLYWCLYTSLAYLMRMKNQREETVVVALVVLNATAFAFLGSYEMFGIYPDRRFWFCLGLSLLYFLVGVIQGRLGRERLTVAHVALGMSLLTIAFPMKLKTEWTSLVWLVEIPFFTFLGCHFQRLTYRAIAFGVAVIMFFRIVVHDLYLVGSIPFLGMWVDSNRFIAVAGILSFWLAGFLIRRPVYRLKEEKAGFWIPEILILFGACVLTVLLWKEVDRDWLSLSWILAGGGMVGVGIFLAEKIYRISGLVLCGFALLTFLVVNLWGLNTIYRIVSCIVLGIVLLLASLAYSRYQMSRRNG